MTTASGFIGQHSECAAPPRFSLSSAQQALWFLSQLHPGDPSHNCSFALHLHGELDRAALRVACQLMLQRHDELRARIVADRGGVSQVIRPYGDAFLADVYSEVDLVTTGLDLTTLQRELALKPFDLSLGPLIRMALVRLSHDAHCLVAVVHHIVFDARSQALVLADLDEGYRAALEGREPKVRPSPATYADYVAWERRQLSERRTQMSSEFWRAAIPRTLSPVQLPRDGTTSDGSSGHWVHAVARVDEGLRARLVELAHGTSPRSLPVLFLSALHWLLRRYGNEGPMCITAALDVRPAMAQRVVGLFVNSLPVVISSSPDPSFSELLAGVGRSYRHSLRHGRLPLATIVQIINPPRSSTTNPLFQVVMGYRNFTQSSPPMGRLTTALEDLHVGAKADLADLVLEVVDSGTHLELIFEARADLLQQATLHRMLLQFKHLLEGVVANPEAPLSRFELLDAAERHRLLVEWNNPEAELVTETTVHHLVEAQAALHPRAKALVAGDETLTYAALECRANQLARHMAPLGVGPDALVAIYMERGIDMIVGLLAILKAGGAYVPLDPTYPAQRLAFMLEDSGARVLVTQAHLLGRLPVRRHLSVICVDADQQAIATKPSTPPSSGATSRNLAYVIYTSGSTGRPKGVMIEHRGLVNLIEWHRLAYGVEPEDRATHVSALGFDASAWELWPHLAAGASVWLPDEQTRASVERLWSWMGESRISLAFLPTPLAEEVIAAGWPAPSSLRTLLTGGDRLQNYPQASQGLTLVNHYGPTECSVVATAGPVSSARKGIPLNAFPPIGRPIANTRVHLLDDHMNVVPAGVPGELYIGGAGVGRGYLNLPELTADHFVRDPFSPVRGTRLYRTGDLGRRLPDGSIEFLGRIDDQVKIRGCRIECGEVEAALLTHSGVLRAAVMRREDVPGDVRLVAYVVPAGGVAPTDTDLRAHLHRTLPDYMVPSTFVTLGDLPLTAHAKVDRQALPPPGEQSLHDRVVAPTTPTEEIVASIWKDMLALDQVSTLADFFDVGGNSLLAIRLLAQLERSFGTRLPLRLLFENTTIRDLAATLDDALGTPREWSSLVPIRPGGDRPPLFLTPSVRGEVVEYRDLVRHLDPRQPVYGLRGLGFEGGRPRCVTIQDMASLYVAEIRRLKSTGPYLLVGYCFGGEVAIEMAHQLHQGGQRVALLALIDAAPPADGRTSRTPTLRRARVRVADLLNRGVPGAAAYVGHRAARARSKLRRWLWLAAYDLYIRSGRPFPTRLQDIQVVNYRALTSYAIPVIPCQLTLFRAAVTGGPAVSVSQWQRLALGGLEVHAIDSHGVAHLTIMKEPHVRPLAAKLSECIERACALDEADR